MRSDATRRMTRGRVPRSRRWRLAYGAGSLAALASATVLTIGGPVRADPTTPRGPTTTATPATSPVTAP